MSSPKKKTKKGLKHRMSLKVAAPSFSGRVLRDFKESFAGSRISAKSVEALNNAVKGLINDITQTISEFNAPSEQKGKQRLVDVDSVRLLLRSIFDPVNANLLGESATELKKVIRKRKGVDVQMNPKGTGGIETFGVSVPKLRRYIKAKEIRLTTEALNKLAHIISRVTKMLVSASVAVCSDEGGSVVLPRHIGRALVLTPGLIVPFRYASTFLSNSIRKEKVFQAIEAEAEEIDESCGAPAKKKRKRGGKRRHKKSYC